MADKVHRIHSLPDDSPWRGGFRLPAPTSIRARSARSTGCSRSSDPSCSRICAASGCGIPMPRPTDIVRILERRYLAAVTTGGAAVGATAVVPGIGTGVTLALSGVETVAFLEATTLFAQSVAEVHGIPVADPDRARALVLTLMLGKEGVDLVAQLAGQAAGRGPSRDRYWGELVTKTLPRAAVGPLVDRLKIHVHPPVRRPRRRIVDRQGAAVRHRRGHRRRRQQHPRPARARQLAPRVRPATAFRCRPSWSLDPARTASSDSQVAASVAPARSWSAA